MTVRATLAEGERESDSCRLGGRCSAGLLARLYDAGDTSMARKWKKAHGAALSVTRGVTTGGGSGTGSERCMMFYVNERQFGVQCSCCLAEAVVGGTEWSFRWLLDGVEAGAGGALVGGGVVVVPKWECGGDFGGGDGGWMGGGRGIEVPPGVPMRCGCWSWRSQVFVGRIQRSTQNTTKRFPVLSLNRRK